MSTQLEIQARIEQYGLLRSALRAIEASSPNANAFGLEASFQQVRGWLAELRSFTEGSPSGNAALGSSAQFVALDSLGRALDELQRAIVDQIRWIPLSQLRATLPAIKRQHPEELKALLDLCLIAHASGSPWWNLIDYLITLLAYEEKNGRRYVARDPTCATPLLQKLCAASEREKTGQTDALAQMFHDARVEVERGIPAGPIITRMRSAKYQALETLLIPDLLRAITAYNVAVSNQRAELVETQRVLEEAELDSFERTLGRRVSEQADRRPPAVAPTAGSALDSEPLRAIVAAVGCLLRRQDPGKGPASELAAALDLSKLSAYEAAALRDPEPGPVTTVVATAATIGLIARALAGLGDRLAQAGVCAEQLRTKWASELESRIRAEAAELVSGDDYEEARRIAEVRTRLLHGPEEEFNAWRLQREVERDRSAKYAHPRPPAPAPTRGSPHRARARAGRVGWRAAAGLVAGAALLAFVASLYSAGKTNTKVAFFSERQLEAISPYIESGYRNGRGSGPAFVGTLRAQWTVLSAAEREASGRAIEEALLAQDISEFMLFDKQRQLMLRYDQGRLVVH